MPTVPVSVWDQVAVVVIFAFLLGGLGWLLARIFTAAIADVNRHYAQVIKDTNDQWQRYFDARSESNKMVNEQMLIGFRELTNIVRKLADDFESHDQMERQALDEMTDRRRLGKT